MSAQTETTGTGPAGRSVIAVAGGEGPQWNVRLLDGPLAGSTWPLTGAPLVIGRGLGCQIRLDDLSVSRNHCRVTQEPEGPRLSNLSERSETLLNGQPTVSARLRAGDVIEIAQYRLMMATGPVQRKEWLEDTQTTLSLSEALHTREDYDAAKYRESPDLTEDLHALFRMLRTTSRAESLDALVGTVRAHLKAHLGAQECWVGWMTHLDGEIALYPPASTEETRRAPMDLMREACALGQGLLPPVYAPEGRAMIAAPLVHGASAFGAVAVAQDFSVGAYTKRQLDYLVSVAECAAPLVRAAERLEQLRRDAAVRRPDETPKVRMLGSGPQVQRLREEVRRASLAKANVLIVGETGVGKELAARTLHDFSPRAAGPYITVNCAAIPPDLFESEMFGHERGAFTGAAKSRKGMFELAHGGTLFLDEVGDLSLPNQARLLRVVEQGSFRRVGAESEILVDVRIVSATNRPLPDGSASYFRSDLFHRLAGIEITVPPLRERLHDVPELAQHYLDEFGKHAPARPRSFTREAIDLMTQYSWPGNIRELRNVVERACYQAGREIIGVADINLPVRAVEPGSPSPDDALDSAERRHIVSVLEQCGWRVADAAKALGLSKSTMYYKLARHRIDVKRRKA